MVKAGDTLSENNKAWLASLPKWAVQWLARYFKARREAVAAGEDPKQFGQDVMDAVIARSTGVTAHRDLVQPNSATALAADDTENTDNAAKGRPALVHPEPELVPPLFGQAARISGTHIINNGPPRPGLPDEYSVIINQLAYYHTDYLEAVDFVRDRFAVPLEVPVNVDATDIDNGVDDRRDNRWFDEPEQPMVIRRRRGRWR